MKGLLIKDFYMARKYCWTMLVIMAVFIVASMLQDDSFFFVFYPCLLSGIIPVTLLGYDERSRWSEYCGALPYTKAQIVSVKYLMGLFMEVVVFVLSAIAQAIRMNRHGAFDVSLYLTLLALLLILFCFSTSICLPFMFKFGVEKGRIAYYVMIGVICGGSVVGSKLFTDMGTVGLPAGGLMLILCAAMVALYALSWYLSIVFYKKREV